MSMAPDAAAAKAGAQLASNRPWSGLGATSEAVWGDCAGSAAMPYRAAVDLRAPAFKCSCPSRKFPCKHCLGLLLMFAREPTSFEPVPAPAWVNEWLDTRSDRADRAGRSTRPRTAAESERITLMQERRARQREERVAAGIEELDLWLRDLVRHGLAELPQRPRSTLEVPVQRLVDAQAPGLARHLSATWEPLHASGGWVDPLLMRLGRLQLLVEAYRRIDRVPETMRAVIRSSMGFAEARDDVLRGDVVRDRWLVVGRRFEVSRANLRSRRTWLRGADSGRFALLLDFAAFGQALDPQPSVGTRFEAGLAFYTGAPLRALIADQTSEPESASTLGAGHGLRAGLIECASLFAREPWLESAPLLVESVRLGRTELGWFVVDADAASLRLHPKAAGWALLAASCGEPIQLFGEWSDAGLLPLGMSGPDGCESVATATSGT